MQKKIVAGNGSSADAVPGGETNYSIGLFNIGTIYKLISDSQVWANFSQGGDLADPANFMGKEVIHRLMPMDIMRFKTASMYLVQKCQGLKPTVMSYPWVV
ncbi:hypothetical protein A6E05_02795 [Aliivibrio sp. 1S165]|nr:hypothetical protein A6E05_02795 [Aliivibrio sp. 1S165]OCH32774.1 hypothetical protein A6E06_01670 [Aliivibrio sp. 1S175]